MACVRGRTDTKYYGSMSDLSYAESVVVACPPDTLYDLVSDVTRMGEWSPICRSCWWDEGGGPRAGAWFTRPNEVPGRTWETRSQVVTAERGREFTFEVNNGIGCAGATPSPPVDGGTELTETWNFRSRRGSPASARSTAADAGEPDRQPHRRGARGHPRDPGRDQEGRRVPA